MCSAVASNAPRSAGRGNGGEVARVPDAAGGDDRAAIGHGYERLEPIDVGASIGADAAKIHGDDAAGPQRGIAEQRVRPFFSGGIEIERQDDSFAESLLNLPPILDGSKALAADHERRPERQPEGAIGDAGEPRIDPNHNFGKSVAEPAHELEMIAAAKDGVEVGDVEIGRTGGGQEATGDRQGIVGRTEGACNRTISGAASALGMDDDAVLEVECRNDCEIVRVAHFGPPITRSPDHRPA